MVDLSFTWSPEDVANMDNTTLRVVTSIHWQDCISNNAWYPEYSEDASLVEPGDVLALVCRDKYAFGVVCSKEDGRFQVAWVNKDITGKLPLGRKYSLEELKEDIAREVQKTTYRFLR